MNIDPETARWYTRLLVLRHLALLTGLTGFLMLVSDAGDTIRRGGAVAFLAGIVGFSLSASVLVLPLVARSVPRGSRSSIALLSAVNQFTGHELAYSDLQIVRRAWLTRSRLRAVVVIEVALFLAALVIAAL